MRDLELNGWRKDAAEILISKLGVCARCVLCVCGCRAAHMFALPEPDLREKILNLIGKRRASKHLFDVPWDLVSA